MLTTSVARIENAFILNARYSLSPREQKIILYLISQINPKEQTRFHEQVVPIKELESALKSESTKWGGLYKEMKTFASKIIKKGIEFPTDVEIEGKEFPGFVNWFQEIKPIKNSAGEVSIRFLFSEPLKPFLLELKQYARISLLETMPMRSSYAIRMFQIFRAHRDKMQRYEKISTLSYELTELRKLLLLQDKYADFRNFKKKVLDIAIEQINKHTSIKVIKLDFKRDGRKIIGVIFKLQDNAKHKSKRTGTPTLPELTYAQIRAYMLLTDYGINPEIALAKLLPSLKSPEFRGFEDWYFELALQIFESRTNQTTQKAKAGTFVKWFMDDFDVNYFSIIMEGVQNRKKKLQRDDPEAWENRMEARDLTSDEFKAKFK